MRGCLFTLALGAILLAVLVTVGLPAMAAGLITGAVTAGGLQAGDTTVTVASDPPTDLIGLHADRVRIRATDATFRGLRIAALDVTLTDVDIPGRTAGGVDGRLTGVVVPDVGARSLTLDSILLAGGGDQVTAATTVPAAMASVLIGDAVESALGTRPTSVRLAAPDRVTVKLGVAMNGRFIVNEAGDLLVSVIDGPAAGTQVVLLRGGEDLPIRMTSATVTANGGLRLGGTLSVGLLG